MQPPHRNSVRAFLAGVLTTNSLVHLASAVAGKEFLTPLAGQRSGPAVNAAWGAVNLLGGLTLARAAAAPGRRWGGELRAFGAGSAAFALWGVVYDQLTAGNTER